MTQHAGSPKCTMIKNIEVQSPMTYNLKEAVGNRKASRSLGTLGTLYSSEHSLKGRENFDLGARSEFQINIL